MVRIEKPVKRSPLRRKCGQLYYTGVRKLLWFRMRREFARERSDRPLPYLCFSHQTPLLRKLKDVEMWLQYNKIVNLKLAVKRLDGIVLRPGEVFSYWRLIGAPTRRKGYLDGMVLRGGSFCAAVGGGLCQLSNLIFWMTLHTPLTVLERHRHSYDVFPDVHRTQPFGSGATCFYPNGDLMLRNDTQEDYQLLVRVGETDLEGQWRCSAPNRCAYQLVERDHEIVSEYWGGYSRHNKIFQQKFDLRGNLLSDELIVENAAIMTYSPFLSDGSGGSR